MWWTMPRPTVWGAAPRRERIERWERPSPFDVLEEGRTIRGGRFLFLVSPEDSAWVPREIRGIHEPAGGTDTGGPEQPALGAG